MKPPIVAVAVAVLCLAGASPALASDHLDSPEVIADARIDIGDLYAWVAPDGRRLNLVMTIVGHAFSPEAAYTFHIGSGPRFGVTRADIDLTCHFDAAGMVDCRLGEIDQASGMADATPGIIGRKGQFRVFAGLRDDPFFNNVRGTRAMYGVAQAAITQGAAVDMAGCPAFNAAQTAALHDAWRHTDGGPATNFLKGWTPATIIVSIDLSAVSQGGPVLAVWASTSTPNGQIDRAARPLTGNALLATLGGSEERDRLKIAYNRVRPQEAQEFAAEIARGAALYDGLDGQCGNGMLVAPAPEPASRYRRLAELLADDRLWLNSRATRCEHLFAVERAALLNDATLADDCGGRTPTLDAVNIYRSLLAGGVDTGIDDGVYADELPVSLTSFPFLAAPAPGGITR